MPQATENKRSQPFQFGLGTILVVMTLGAAIFAIGRLTEAPFEWQIGISCYFFVLLLYFAFRVPYLVRVVFGKDSDWQRVKAKRQELESLAAKTPADENRTE